MTCQEYWDSMPELEGGGKADATAHAGECAVCAAALRNQEALSAGLREVAAEWGRIKAPGRVEAKLLAEFRGQAGLAAPPLARRWWSPVVAWAAAAMVVAAAFLLFVVRNRQPQATAAATGLEAANTDWSALAPEGVSDEAGGDFIPLPNADRLPQAEDLNVVRVEVPRSAMIALGYSVAADRASERVRADVLVGSDGLARAVRFLDE